MFPPSLGIYKQTGMEQLTKNVMNLILPIIKLNRKKMRVEISKEGGVIGLFISLVPKVL